MVIIRENIPTKLLSFEAESEEGMPAELNFLKEKWPLFRG